MMNKQNISFRLVAFTDAAGKYSPQAFRSGNEDNFFVDDDLTDEITNSGAQDEVLHLGKWGMLMAIADGMGGMNAGEVASQIAVDTVKAAFNQKALQAAAMDSPQDRQRFLESVIKQADKNIKSEARKDRSREGMGSTIILAWLFNDELSISWCGDSRAYIFNEKSGIRLVSQDHSYVQELVNKGLLTYDQTFDHPQNNIITRSLGDPSKDAKPESKTLKVGKGDVILLCSDGLSGVLRDRKTYGANGQLFPEDNLEDIISAHSSSMKECREALWSAAEKGGWYDNVTAILCKITDGPESPWGTSVPVQPDGDGKSRFSRIWLLLGVLILIGALAAFLFFSRNRGDKAAVEPTIIDSVVSDSVLAQNPENVTGDTIKQTSPETSEKNDNEKSREIPSFQEQKKYQSEENINSKTKPEELTKIEKRRDNVHNKNSDNVAPGELTPIKDRVNNETDEKKLTPIKQKN